MKNNSRLLSFIPISGGYIILCGAISKIYYYHYFHIDIISYIEISELITSFLEGLYLYIPVNLIAILIWLSFDRSQIIFSRKKINKKDIEKDESQFISSIFSPIFALIFLIGMRFIPNPINYIMLGIFFIVVFLSPFLVRSTENRSKLIYVNVLILNIGVSILLATIDFNFAFKNNHRIKVEYSINSVVYRNDDSKKFIGKTQNFIFFQVDSLNTLAYSLKELDWINFDKTKLRRQN